MHEKILKDVKKYRERSNQIKHNIETVGEFIKKLDHEISCKKLENTILDVGFYTIDIITTATGVEMINTLKLFLELNNYEDYIQKKDCGLEDLDEDEFIKLESKMKSNIENLFKD